MTTKDVVIIGAGVTGCAIVRELSFYRLDVLVLEKEEDVCSGTSKANSAIVHAGFDAKPGTLKARFNVEGSRRMEALVPELHFAYAKKGALVLCFSDEERDQVQALYDRGIANGLKPEELEILTGDEARALEPALTDEVVSALHAKSSAIVCPFDLTCAFAENAAANGVEFRFLTAVEEIRRDPEGYLLTTGDGETIRARFVINAAGVHADRFHNMVSDKKLHITARKGDYLLMDKEAGGTVLRTIFQLPGRYGKGVLVTPTVHGNLLAGPTAVDTDDRENTATTAAELAEVQKRASMSVKNMPFRQVITSFSGLRAHEDDGDFVIGECPDAPGFFDAAGIESPGLSAAPAIGLYLAGEIVKAAGAEKKSSYTAERKPFRHFALSDAETQAELIRQDPDYARVICRCETV
ncbi:MAG: NAD(P)/FAD-dependent oxidoreductase, partial [Lachnospiraceae bacterium]|nr:NAD(P)/FAD-dependent oxidoreductase [Lachnospiraceae bacterium]